MRKTPIWIFPAIFAVVFAGLILSVLISTKNAPVVAEHDLDKIVECTDTRDGETFRIQGRDIHDVRGAFFQDQCFELTDMSGKDRTVCESHQTWLKCEVVEEGTRHED